MPGDGPRGPFPGNGPRGPFPGIVPGGPSPETVPGDRSRGQHGTRTAPNPSPLWPMTPMVEYSRLTGYFGILGSRPPSQIRFLASFGEDTQGSQIRFLASFVGHFAGKSQAKLATDRIWDDRWCCATSAFRGPGRSARSSQLALALAIASPGSNAIARP